MSRLLFCGVVVVFFPATAVLVAVVVVPVFVTVVFDAPAAVRIVKMAYKFMAYYF